MIRIFMLLVALIWFAPAHAQQAVVVASCGSITLDVGGPRGLVMDTKGRLCNDHPYLQSGSTSITGNASGTTAAVVGTLAAASGLTTYICGFNVQAIGGTATVGPIVVAGLVGSSQTYQTDVNSATVGKTVAQASFSPCIPASATNTAITVTTTANGTATAVNVNSWGFRQ